MIIRATFKLLKSPDARPEPDADELGFLAFGTLDEPECPTPSEDRTLLYFSMGCPAGPGITPLASTCTS